MAERGKLKPESSSLTLKSGTEARQNEIRFILRPLVLKFGKTLKYLRSKNPNVKIYGIEPTESNVLNGGKPGPHQIIGNGVGFKPDMLDMDVMEEVLMAFYQHDRADIGLPYHRDHLDPKMLKKALKANLHLHISDLPDAN
ncbi:hypothetical protein HAX54_026376 [Datura stramonium]|uniref:Uncharacterized protein n=1 Tax=Datura stramonium TaxID=4076 RepID=A0ABS8RKD5_DATST|nr:hypothetical protein [Datura stramonium]